MSIIQGTGGGLGGAGAPGGALAGGAVYSHTIGQSLRFEEAGSSYLTFTPNQTGTDNKRYTFSVWIKLAQGSGDFRTVFSSKNTGSGTGQGHNTYAFDTGDDFAVFTQNGGANPTSPRLYRDPNSWYHFLVAYDTTQSTDTDRVKVYVNGTQQTDYTGTFPGLNSVMASVNTNGQEQRWGRYVSAYTRYFNGYMAEIHMVDGQALDPTSFGETKDGVWVPKQYADNGTTSHGVNGYHLTFQGTGTSTTTQGNTAQTNIGDDQSGNGNNWAVSGIVSDDVLLDSPTNNFATLNPLAYSTLGTLSEGNLKIATSTNNRGIHGTISIPSSGKWYWELHVDSYASGGGTYVGFGSNASLGFDEVAQSKGIFMSTYNQAVDVDGSTQSSPYNSQGNNSTSNGDIYSFALDVDNQKFYVAKNGTYRGSSDPSAGSGGLDVSTVFTNAVTELTVCLTRGGSYNETYSINFGQDSKDVSSANSDANGIGTFEYAVPTGFLALCTSNLPDITIGPGQSEQADDYFETILYSGNGGIQHIGAGGAQHPQDVTTIANSLVFNGSDEELTAHSPSSAGNQKTWTWSAWVKRSKLGALQTLFSTNQSSNDATAFNFGFTAADKLVVSPWNNDFVTTSIEFKDTSKFYHILLKFDTTQTGSNNSDRVTIYVDGVEQTLVNGSATLAHDTAYAINQTEEHRIGNWESVNWFFGGYLAEVNFVDGTAYDADTFGQVGSNGYWIPKALSGISYGTNGFRLTFENSSYLGYDYQTSGRSGTTNDFTATNLAATDQVTDSPTQNFAVLDSNYINSLSQTFSEGNLDFTSDETSSNPAAVSTFAVNTGKWYWEVYIRAVGNTANSVGIASKPNDLQSDSSALYSKTTAYSYQPTGSKRNNADVSYGATWTTGDIIGVALDLDAGTLKFYKNGAIQNSGTPAFTGLSSTEGFTSYSLVYVNGAQVYNFGQDDSFNNNKTSGTAGASDANGVGTFYYTPPSGHLALVDDNISKAGIESPDFVWIKERSSTSGHALHDSVRGAGKYLGSHSTSAEGTSTTQVTSFDANGFTTGPSGQTNESSQTYASWNWKAGGISPTQTYAVTVADDSGQNKYRFDGNTTFAPTLSLQEGGTYTFDQSDSSNSGHPLRFSTTSDGTHGSGSEYTVGVTTSGTPGSSGAKTVIALAYGAPTLYYYCNVHSGMGGQVNTTDTHGSTNLKGSIQSVVSASTDAGFSIVTWDALGSSTGTVGHGLTVAPDIIIAKARDHGTNWFVQVPDVLANTHMLNLETTGGDYNPGYNHFNDTVPTDNVFSIGGYLGNHSDIGNSNTDKIAYCFHSVDGYSKVGSYVGNGSADGTFIYAGLRPAWIIIKNKSASAEWVIVDNKRSTFNEVDVILAANATSSEANIGTSNRNLDFLSNGFKIRSTAAGGTTALNTNGSTYIYLAFAEQPFKFANAR